MDKLLKSVKEIPQEVVGKVKGQVPNWINGSLLRVGPGKWDLKDGFQLNHYLDGCAIVVKIKFDDGKVTYSSRFVESDAYKKMMELGKPVFTEFGTRAYTDTTKSVWKRVVNKVVPSDLTDNDISNIYKINDEVYVATESCNIWQVDTNSLGVKSKTNIDKLCGVAICSSHPHHSDADGVTYNIGSSFLTGMKYHVMKIPDRTEKSEVISPDNTDSPSGYRKAQILSTIPASHMSAFSYTHSFFVTEHFIVFVEQPLLVNGYKLATCTPKGKPLSDCLQWLDTEPTRFHVIDKFSGSLRKDKYQSKAFYFFHTINAYEEGNFLIMDVVAYDDASVLDKYHIDKLRRNEWDSSCPPIPKRFVIPLGNSEEMKIGTNLVQIAGCEAKSEKMENGVIWMEPEELGPAGFELPRINYKQCNGKPYQYVYGSGVFEKGFFANSICKLDVKNKVPTTWKESDTAFPGEAVFIPRPGGTSEDDGHVVSIVIETDPNKPHFVVILDAKAMTETARIEFSQEDVDIPATIHGIFINH